jgi:hypothetical protein
MIARRVPIAPTSSPSIRVVPRDVVIASNIPFILCCERNARAMQAFTSVLSGQELDEHGGRPKSRRIREEK